MRALFLVIDLALEIYIWLLIAAAILSWLVAFNVVNTRNPLVSTVGDVLYRLTEPVLGPIRRRMPHTGGIDLSPIVLFLGLLLLERIIIYYVYPNVF